MRKLIHYFPALLFVALLLGISSCSSVPDHARYIPKDAVAVLDVNTGGMQKKIAWNAILGSKLLDEMRNDTAGKKAEGMLRDAEQAGIDFGSHLYLFAKADTRYQGEVRAGAVLPLKDAGKFEAFLKKYYPNLTVTENNGLREAALDKQAYAAWNKDAVLIQNPIQITNIVSTPYYGDTAVGGVVDTIRTVEVTDIDLPGTQAELRAAFDNKKDNSIAANDRFKKLSGAGHDISFYLDYGGLMSKVGGSGDMGMLSGLGRNLYVGTAMTTGIDFKSGKITGEVLYYPSDSLREVSKAFGNESISSDMVSRLPGNGLNLVATYHISTRGVEVLLNQLGMLGMANMGLASQGISLDNILNAFTGDFGFTLNNFTYKQEALDLSGMDSTMIEMMPPDQRQSWQPQMDFTFALGIKNRAEADRLLVFLQKAADLQPAGKDRWKIPDMPGKELVLALNDQYAVVSSPAGVDAFFAKQGGLSGAPKDAVAGHPIGIYVDVRSILAATPQEMLGPDATMLMQARDFFTTASMHGGEFTGKASKYELELNLQNQDENALIQLLSFAQRAMAQEKARQAGVMSALQNP